MHTHTHHHHHLHLHTRTQPDLLLRSIEATITTGTDQMASADQPRLDGYADIRGWCKPPVSDTAKAGSDYTLLIGIRSTIYDMLPMSTRHHGEHIDATVHARRDTTNKYAHTHTRKIPHDVSSSFHAHVVWYSAGVHLVW